ncbi:MAG: 3-dehydroquinate synthase [Magnetococcales bacterium]|nr:3-dehydroquinate synthase [Magnetococcales bacterium]NGZ25883.1 3-dehydroquinate synthase [Magnetococcales bacterium]
MTRSLQLDLGNHRYAITIGAGILPTLGSLLVPLLKGKQVAVVTNQTVAPLYLAEVQRSLQEAGFQVLPIILPDGEIYKNHETLQLIYDALIANRFERSCCLVALGGGVIGDMTGFAAASFLRGVSYVQVPTTLLSQVDSSVGGKTGINHPLGKNLIGAFYQPQLVLIDTYTLTTLPSRQFLSGMAEVIKYGIAFDADFFDFLGNNQQEILALQPDTLAVMIEKSCAIKAKVVEEDEKESGRRALLNLGHTFGHAIETLTHYDTFLHGEAVAIGMVMAADLSHRVDLCDYHSVNKITDLINSFRLPIHCPIYSEEAYLDAMSRDKKVAAGKVRFVLLAGIGQALMGRSVAEEAVRATIRDRVSFS